MTDFDNLANAVAGDLIADAPLSACNSGACDLVQACGATPVVTSICGPDAPPRELSNQKAGEHTSGSDWRS